MGEMQEEAEQSQMMTRRLSMIQAAKQKLPKAPKMKLNKQSKVTKGLKPLFDMASPPRQGTHNHVQGKLARVAEDDEKDEDDDKLYVRLPLFIPLISLAQIAVFVYYYSDIKTKGDLTRYRQTMTHSLLIYHPLKSAEFWRFVTYQLLHADIWHLTANLAVRLIIGIPFEMVHGWWRVMLIYCVGVVFGAMFSAIFNTITLLLGASGGDFSLVFALLANFVMNSESMPVMNKIISILTVLLLAGCEVVSTFFGNRVSVSWPAHLGGAVAGLIFGICVVDNRNERNWEKYARYVAALLFVLITAAGLAWIFLDGSERWDEMMGLIHNGTVAVAA